MPDSEQYHREIGAGKTQVLWVAGDRAMENHRFVVEALGRRGFGTVVVTSLKRAMFRLRNITVPLPNAVVVDVYDYGWDGFPFIAELRREPRTRSLPVIAISTDCETVNPFSGRDMRSHAVRTLEAGAMAYHQIPFRIEELVADIEMLVKPE